MAGAHGRYILVVEDNPVNQEVIGQTLARHGCRVRLADSAVTGLQALREERFDLVMMDLQMPGMDGVMALRQFRQSVGGGTPADTPVVAATADARQGEEARFLALGFDDVLPKPFRQQQLQELLARFFLGPDEQASAAAPGSDPRAPEPTPMPAAPPLLDPLAIERLRELDPGGSNQLLARIIGAYINSLDRLLPELAQARQAGLDLSVIRHVSHTLKSSSAALGAMALAELCADIETQARTGQADGLDAALDAMLSHVSQVRLAMTALLTAP